MKLQSLHLTNVRKFTGKRASITGIGPGITVVSQANEFGKSTFFDAVHALFFEKYSSTAKPVKSLQPYAGGAVEIAAQIETAAGLFRVEKRFMAKKMARILRMPEGVIIAQDDEAERWITDLLGETSVGPAGLLWVRQGVLGLEAETPKDKTQQADTRRDLLTSIAGEIDAMTGGKRMDRVMQRLGQDLAAIATKTGKKTGAWKAAADEVVALGAELASVTAQVETLDSALAERKDTDAALAKLDDPEGKARRAAALISARTAMDTARAHEGLVTAARRDRDIAALQAKGAEADLTAFLRAIDGLARAETAALLASQTRAAREAEASALKRTVDDATARVVAAQTTVGQARSRLDLARHQTEARKAKARALDLAAQIARAQQAQNQRDAARARMNAVAATPDWLAGVEAAASDFAKREMAHQAQSAVLSVVYSGAARLSLDGVAISGDSPVVLGALTQIDLPGIGQMTLRTQAPAADGAALLAKAAKRLADLLALCGVKTLAEARSAAAARTEAAGRADLAQAVLNTLAPKGIDALTAAMAEATLAAAEAQDDPLPGIADLEQDLTTALSDEAKAAQTQARAAADHALAREAAVKAAAQDEAAVTDLDRARAAAGVDATREARRADLLRRDAQSAATLTQTEAALTAQIASAQDLATSTAELNRAEAAVNGVSQQRAQQGEKLAALSAQIRTLAGHGIEERRDDLRGQLETATASEVRFARKFAALTRLSQALEAERTAAQDTYFGPVHEELKPLLAILHRDASLSFDRDNLLPSGLTRGQTEETLENLSGGTKEQIAILTRLAFARLFARQGRHMPIVLDDALVFSDDDRIIKMFTALTRAAQDQQILVFSCRQLAFQDLGGARPVVEISDT